MNVLMPMIGEQKVRMETCEQIMIKIIFGFIIGYMTCNMNAGNTMKEIFVDSGAKEIVIEKIEEIK